MTTEPTTSMSTDTLSVTIDGGVAEVALTRPDLLNRFDADLHRDFVQALRFVAAPDVRVVVLHSSGKVFSAGGDFDFMRQIHADAIFRQEVLAAGRELVMTLVEFPVPIVVGLQGDAIGLGATVALCCDVIVAARAVRIADPHVVVGLVAGDGGCLVWPQSMGLIKAKRHLLTGDPVTAADAFVMGLVTDLVEEPTDVLSAAREIAHRIAGLPPLAVRGTKAALNKVFAARATEILDLSIALEGMTATSEDLLEAISALKDRRPGRYIGR